MEFDINTYWYFFYNKKKIEKIKLKTDLLNILSTDRTENSKFKL